LEKEKSMEKAVKSLQKYGEDGVQRFLAWGERFL
jgi:uncharacterized protein